MNEANETDFKSPAWLERTPSWLCAAALLLLSLGVFMAFNFDRELLRLECRYMVFARELANGGAPGLFPTLYGEPYADYLSTYTLLTFGLAKLLGSLSTFALVLPVAFVMAASVATTFLIGAERSKALGLFAALLLLCTYGFLDGGRTVAMDAFSCFGAVCAFRFAQLWSLRAGAWSALHFLCGLLAAAFAFAFRGPIGAVVASAAFIAWPLGAFEWRRSVYAALACGALFAALTGGMLYAAWTLGGEKLLEEALHSQIGGRLAGAGKPPWLYFTNGLAEFAAAFPLALIALFFARKTVWRANRSSDIELFGRFMAWGLLIVVGLTLPATRHLRYILPAIPAFALAAACLFVFAREFAPPKKVLDCVKALTLGRLALTACVVCVLCSTLVEWLEGRSQESRPFVEKLEKELPSSKGYAFMDLGPDGEELKVLCNSKIFFKPFFVAKPEELNSLELPVVARKKAFDALPDALRARVVKRVDGELGHKDCVAFLLLTK